LVFGLLDDIDNTNYARGNTLNKKIFSINMWNQIKESLLRINKSVIKFLNTYNFLKIGVKNKNFILSFREFYELSLTRFSEKPTACNLKGGVFYKTGHI